MLMTKLVFFYLPGEAICIASHALEEVLQSALYWPGVSSQLWVLSSLKLCIECETCHRNRG